MSIAEKIREAVGFTQLPCYQNNYDGDEKQYWVFNLSSIPADFANDEPQHEVYMVQLHLFCPYSVNTSNLQKEVKRSIQYAGFSFPSLENASDADGQHLVFEFQTAEGV